MHKIKLLNSNAKMPNYQTPNSAGLDLYTSEEITLYPKEIKLVNTGIAIQLEENEEAQIRPRSGLSLKGLLVILGTVDSDYRGEIKIIVTNLTEDPMHITKHMRIAQMVINPIKRINFQVCDNLDMTTRNESGFGSTGIN